MSTTIRIDPDTYRRLLEAKARLEIDTGKPRSFNDTVDFLLTLGAGKKPSKPNG
jgi:hypothetical protein